MKKLIISASIVITFTLFSFFGCKNGASSIENETPDEILGKTYKVDFSGLSSWSDSFDFDKTSGKLTISQNYLGGGIWNLNFNASDYNYLEITYSQSKGSFLVRVEYDDGTHSSMGCAEYVNTTYVSLDSEKKSKISAITIESKTSYVTTVIEGLTFTEKKPVLDSIVDKKDGNFNSSISALDFAKQLKVGWNLAETLESHADSSDNPKELGLAFETFFAPDQPYTSKEIIHLPKETGYSSIRIPVTWYNHVIDDNYTIDPQWMSRIKQVVDWAIQDGYYVILNEHHSKHKHMSTPIKYGEGYIVRNTTEDIAESERFLKAIWTQIATAFNGSYDEHLIFEFMNEPTNAEHGDHEWNPGLKTSWADYSTCEECLADYKILNEYNQVCLDAIRSTGGNNTKRFLIIPGLCEQEKPILHELFKLPVDDAQDKLMVTTHSYIMGVTEEYIQNKFTPEIEAELVDLYAKLNDAYVKKGIPVIVGETHTLRSIPYAERVKWAKSFYKIASSYGMPVLYWEGTIEKSNHFDRKNLTVIEPEFVKLLIDSWYTDGGNIIK